MRAFLCWRTEMIRAASFYLAASLATATLPCPLRAQSAADVQNYFQGKQVQLKIDMPGTQQGVDLRFDRGTPMDWKQYSSRLKKFGVAIPKDGRSTITTISVKKDMIEFQLDGGGFGTFGDDTNTTVTAKPVEKSNYEKQLEQDIANTDDPDRKRDLQRDLDRERDRRRVPQPDQGPTGGPEPDAGRLAIQPALDGIDSGGRSHSSRSDETARALCRFQRGPASRAGRTAPKRSAASQFRKLECGCGVTDRAIETRNADDRRDQSARPGPAAFGIGFAGRTEDLNLRIFAGRSASGSDLRGRFGGAFFD